jgi:hypothetical protein
LASGAPADAPVEAAECSDALVGQRCLMVRAAARAGGVLTGTLPLPAEVVGRLSDAGSLQFWLRVQNPNVNEFRGANPVIELRCRGGSSLTYTPVRPNGRPANLLLHAPFSEARWGWQPVAVPLAGGGDWQREVAGNAKLTDVEAVVLRFEEPGRLPFTVWVDGLSIR